MLGALNGDFKNRKKESMATGTGLVGHVGDMLVHRVCDLLIVPYFYQIFSLTSSLCLTCSKCSTL